MKIASPHGRSAQFKDRHQTILPARAGTVMVYRDAVRVAAASELTVTKRDEGHVSY